MSWIRTILPSDPAAQEGRLARIYRRHRQPDGLVDHIVTSGSLNPEALDHHLALYEHLMRGESGLTWAERELVAVAVSVVNDCHY